MTPMPEIPSVLVSSSMGQRLQHYLTGQPRYSSRVEWIFGDILESLGRPMAEWVPPPELELWNRHLTQEQRQIAYATGFVPVIGSLGRRWYVSADPNGGSSCIRDSAGYWISYCLIVSGVSSLDAAIAKVMLLQSDEYYFTSIAIPSKVHRYGYDGGVVLG